MLIFKSRCMFYLFKFHAVLFSFFKAHSMCLCISIGFKTRVGFLYGSLILVLSLIFKFDQLLSLLLRINVSRIYSLIFEHICFPAAIYAAYACAISQQFSMRLHWLCFINFARQRYTIGTWPTPIADYSSGLTRLYGL